MQRRPVLIVDENPNARMRMERALDARGLKNIVHAANGNEAIAVLEKYEAPGLSLPRPSLMLLDLHLPDRDGFEVLRWIRSRARWDSFPVIVFTASDAPEDIRRAHQLGCNAYVLKPEDPAETMYLAGAIREFWLRYHCPLDA